MPTTRPRQATFGGAPSTLLRLLALVVADASDVPRAAVCSISRRSLRAQPAHNAQSGVLDGNTLSLQRVSQAGTVTDNRIGTWRLRDGAACKLVAKGLP